MKVDIHIHSRYSDGANTPREIVEYAKGIGLDGVAITDHNTMRGSIEALRYESESFRIIPGMEVSSLEGHILCLGVTELIARDIPAEEVIERAHELGGIAIAAHPFDRFRSGVGDLVFNLNFDAVELYNGHTLASTRDIEGVRSEIKIPVVGGSDAHRLEDVGLVYIETGDDPIESIKKGEVEVFANIDRSRIVKGYLRHKMNKLRSAIDII